MSLASLLSIARSALLAQQRAMDVTAHNVANAQTPGYSRQRLELRALDPVRLPEGLVGRGVSALGIARLRDGFLDATFRRESGRAGWSSTLRDGLRGVEAAIGEPSDAGVTAAIDRLFHAFADLADRPAEPAARQLVYDAGSRLAERLRSLDGRLRDASADALSRAQGQVAEANDLMRTIAELNGRILSAGGAAPDLEDRRDALVDRLSSLVGVRAIPRGDGTVALQGEGVMFVNGTFAATLRLAGSGSAVVLEDASGARLAVPGGSIGGALELVNTRIPAVLAELDRLAAALVAEVNAVHRTGVTATGGTNQDFFDPAGTTAGTIALAGGVRASTGAIAAAASALPGDGTVALQLSRLADASLAALGGRTFRDFMIGVASDVGLASRSAATDAEVQDVLLQQADGRRTEVSGVSLDEEMMALIAHQQAYGAATRIVGVADEMMRLLLETL